MLLVMSAALFLPVALFAQEWNVKKEMPVSIDQMIAQPFDKYDTTVTTNACSNASNNNYSSAINLTVGAAAISGRTCGTIQAGESKGCNNTANQSVWYTVTSTATTTYIIIDAAGSNCYVGSVIWPAAGLPGTKATMINCQSAANGPGVTVFSISGAIGKAYAIQVTYDAGGPCGQEGTFTIRAANSYSGTISNPGPDNSCSTAYNGCYFTATPTTQQVTSNCSAYPLTTQTNKVNNSFYSFTTAPVNSNVLSFQDIISSTCGGGGNVAWFFYRLYDQYCNLVSYGDLGNLQNNVACNQPYILEYMWEQLSCSYTQHYPFQYVPNGTIGCGTPLPVEFLSFEAAAKNNTATLSFATATELNNDFFLVERSADHIMFEPVAKIKAKGYSTQVTTYTTKDILPGNGPYYYRIKQVDINGDFSYSKVITVTTSSEQVTLCINNPVKTNAKLLINTNCASTAKVEYINCQGAVCASSTHQLEKGINTITDNADRLMPGVYTVVVTTANAVSRQKMIKV